MAKIFWTKEETDAVLSRAVVLYDRGFSAFDAIKQGQREALDPNRHRTLHTQSACVNLIKRLKNDHAFYVLKKNPAPLEVVEKPVITPETALAQTLEGTLDSMAAQLAKQLAAEFAAIFKASVRGAVEELVSEFKVMKHNPEYSSEKTRLQRIIIIGLLGDQVHNIEREFGSLFDLKFIDTDRANGLTPLDADAYLLMKNFINHPLYHKYRDFKNHVLIDGGMTSLRTWLHARSNLIIAEANAKAKHH